jgi:hypothetical protein
MPIRFERRDFIALIGGALSAWPFVAAAQRLSAKVPRIGWLVTGSLKWPPNLGPVD